MRWQSFVAASLITTAAYAQSSAERAEALFRDGRAAVVANDYASACPKFADSQRLEPAPGTLMNLADCEEHIGQIIAARNDYALAGAGFPRDDPRRAFVLQHANDLEKRFARLTVRLPKDAPAGTVVRRGRAVLDTDKPIETDPGETTLVVTAPGRSDRKTTLRLRDAESVETLVEVGAPDPTKTVVVHETTRSSTWRVTGFVVGGVGLSSVAVGALTGVLAIGKASTVKSHCDAMYRCDAQGVDAGSEGRVLSPLSTVTLIAGGALVAIATTLVLWNGGSAKPSATSLFAPGGVF